MYSLVAGSSEQSKQNIRSVTVDVAELMSDHMDLSRIPSPLDALIASHIYPVHFLPRSSPLVAALDEQPELQEYVRRVLDEAAASM